MRDGHRVGYGLAVLSLVQVFVLPRPASGQVVQGECGQCDLAIHRALKLLPKVPSRVTVVDLEKSPPSLRQRIKGAEAFVTAGIDGVCLTKQGSTLQLAHKGAGVWDYALAIIIWHEMAHLAGADEREAQRQEEELWEQYIRQGRIQLSQGTRYLALLRKRHP